MSMSSLSAQLAALNKSSAANAPTRNQNDAIGRGLHHSKQHGHTLLHTPHSKNKPSLLHPDPRSAASIPVSTLLSNARAALTRLTSLDKRFYRYGDTLLSLSQQPHTHERVLLSAEKNKKLDVEIISLLTLLSPLWGTRSEALHVAEYLLRRYDVHARGPTAEALLISALPRHESAFFARVIQCIDLTDLPGGKVWLFLRPFTAPGVQGTVNRAVLAKKLAEGYFMKAILKYLSGQVGLYEQGGGGSEWHRGVESNIGFCTVMMMQGLNAMHKTQGRLEEDTVGLMIPYIEKFLREDNGCHAAIRWSYVMISILLEKTSLSAAAKEMLCDGILSGPLRRPHDTYEGISLHCQAVQTLLLLLDTITSPTEPSTSHNTFVLSNSLVSYGCHLSPRDITSLTSLLTTTALSSTLAELWLSHATDIRPLVGGLLSALVSSYCSHRDDGDTTTTSRDALGHLLSETNLAPFWQHRTHKNQPRSSLASLITEKLLTLYAKHPHSDNPHSVREWMELLRTVDEDGVDAGIAAAVGGMKRGRRHRLKEVLKGICTTGEGGEDDVVLPVKIALSHPERKVRMEAITRLTADESRTTDDKILLLLQTFGNDTDPDVGNAAYSALLPYITETESLLSHSDPMTRSTLAALNQWHIADEDVSLEKDAKRTSSSSGRSVGSSTVTALCHALALTGRILSSPSPDSSETLTRDREWLLAAAVAHFGVIIKGDPNETLHSAATSAIKLALRDEGVKIEDGGEDDRDVQCLLAESDVCHALFEKMGQEMISEKNKKRLSSSMIRDKFVWTAMGAFSHHLSSNTSGSITPILSTTLLQVSTSLLSSSLSLTPSQSTLITSALQSTLTPLCSPLTSSSLTTLSKLVTTLTSLPEKIYQTISLPVLQSTLLALSTHCSPTLPPLLLSTLCLTPSTPPLTLLRLLYLLEPTPHPLTLLPTLSLLSHDSIEVRTEALTLILKQGRRPYATLASGPRARVSVTAESGLRAARGFWEGCLTVTPDVVKQEVMEGCVGLVTGTKESVAAVGGQKIWKEWKDGRAGVYNAVAGIVECVSGLDGFDALELWKGVGRPVWDYLWGLKQDDDVVEDMTPEEHKLISIVTGLLRGTNNSSPSSPHHSVVTVAVGRKRSYSFEGNQDISSSSSSAASSYSDDMTLAIITALKESPLNHRYRSFMRDNLLRTVLTRSSFLSLWEKRISPSLQSRITQALVTLRINDGVDEAGVALGQLPLTCREYTNLLEELKDDAATSFVTDVIRHRAAEVVKGCEEEDVKGLIDICVRRLRDMSVRTKDMTEPEDGEGWDYDRFSLLRALVALFRARHTTVPPSPKRHRRSKDTKNDNTLSEHATLLVTLLSTTTSRSGVFHTLRPVTASKPRLEALSLLTHILSSVNSSPHLLSTIRETLISGGASDVPALKVLLPCYLREATRKDVTVDLVREVVTHGDWGVLARVWADLDQGSVGVASLTAGYLANKGYVSLLVKEDGAMDTTADGPVEDDEDGGIVAVLTMLESLTPSVRIGCLLQLLRYVGGLLLRLSQGEEEDEFNVTSSSSASSDKDKRSNAVAQAMTLEQLIGLAIQGTDTDGVNDATPGTLEPKQLRSVMHLVSTLLSIIREGLASPDIKNIIRSGEAPDQKQQQQQQHATLCLQLWQQLLHVQSSTLSSSSHPFYTAARATARDCLLTLQNALPVSHFLASVTSLLRDSSADGALRRRALRLLSERAGDAVEDEDDGATAILFLEVIPELTNMVVVPKEKVEEEEEEGMDRRDRAVTRQSALVAIEMIAQSVCRSESRGDEMVTKGAAFLIPALTAVVTIVNGQDDTDKDIKKEDDDTNKEVDILRGQVFSTASLCGATLIKALKMRCLPLLSKMVSPLLTNLIAINSQSSSSGTTTTPGHHLQTLQRQSILRVLIAAVETLPQFIAPHLPTLLSPHALPGVSILDHNDVDAVQLARHLERAVAERTPARRLLPTLTSALATAMTKRNDGDGVPVALLSLLRRAVSAGTTSRSQVVSHLSVIVSSLLAGYERTAVVDSVGQASREKLLPAVNAALLAVVLKLSETNLKSLYARLREWRGGFGEEEEDEDEGMGGLASPAKRRAFWSLTAALASRLKGIFLPCLATVVEDMFNELEFFAKRLCIEKSSLSHGKKRKSGVDDNDNDNETEATKAALTLEDWAPLPPLLRTLEEALKADAHEGGSWIRATERRYEALLTPLASLLHARFPASDNKEKGNDYYALLVDGVDQDEEDDAIMSMDDDADVKAATIKGGSVSGVLISLAVAAGNERQWKPLNHALVRACGSERAEVRRAAVAVLLEVLKAVGEEYVVLLPECLPALSELMEDVAHEEIVDLARECVQVAEEVLGESLEDSLR